MYQDESGRQELPVGRENSPDLSPEKAALLLERAGIGLVVLNSGGLIQCANSLSGSLLGIAGDLVGKSLSDILLPEDCRRLTDALSEGKQGGSFQVRVESADRGEHEVSVDFSSHGSGDERCTFMALRQAGGRPAENRAGATAREMDFRAIADYAYDWENWVGVDGRLLWVNPAVERITGYTQVEAMTRTDFFQAIVDPEDLERILRSFDGAMRGTSGNDVEFRVRRKDGRRVWCAVSWQPIFGTDGLLLGHRSSIRDIERRKAVEEELRENRRQLSTLLSNLPGMAYRCTNTPTWPMDFVSDGCLELTGYEAGEIMSGRVKYGELIYPEDRQSVWDGVQAGVSAGRPFQLQYRIVRKDGDIRWVWEQGRCIETEGGHVALEGFITDITARVKADRALRQSEIRYRSVVESSPMGIHLYRLESDGRLVFEGANPAADTILNVDNSEFVGKTLEEAFPQLAQTEVPERYRAAARNGSMWETEQIYYEDERIAGAFQVVAFQVSPGRMAALFLDITERKRTQEALKESEYRFRLAFRTIPDAVAISRFSDGTFVEINEGFTANTGYTTEDLTGVSSRDIGLWVDPGAREHLVRMLYEQGRMENLETEFRRKDGSVLIGLMSACLLTLNGEPHILSITRNIQDLKDTREALRREMERAQQYLDTAATLMMAVDDEGRIIMINRKGADLLGYAEEDLIGRSAILQLIPEEDRDDTRAAYGKYISGQMEGLDYSEARVLTASGESRLLAWYTTKVRDEEGRIRGILTSGIDITERRRMEEDLRNIHAQLEEEHNQLQKKNIALREVLGQIEGEKEAVKRLIIDNIEADIAPTVQRLKAMATEGQRPLFDVLDESLGQITSGFAAGLKERFHGLTPRQLQICRMIKSGYSSKEIAEAIGTSVLTVHKHREAIRGKLGLKNRNLSLNSYLQTL